jgi:predicted dehydrogenase/threonine dehydrogenase-like Zn-dependent dehydrogenase
MKQLLQNMRTGKTTVSDVPVPALKPNLALVRTAVSLVSAGTERMVVEFAEKSLVGKARSRPDLVRQLINKARREGLLTTIEAAFNRLDQPMALGYSSAGRIVALGEGISGFQAGQRVACAGGNYAVHAEYAVVPQNLLVALPDQVNFESAAFTTLGAIAMHGFRLAESQIGESVAVIGLGLLGLLSVGIARAAGCRVLGIDLNPDRVALAQKLGAEAVHRDQAEQAARSFGRGRGIDSILICADTSSSDPVELAGTIARDRARVIAVGAVGLNIPRKIYYEKELTLLNSRSYGPGRYDKSYEEKGQDYPAGYVRWTENRNMEAFIDLLTSERLDIQPLITHRFSIDQAPQAYELITGKTQEPFLGVLLTYETPGDKDGEWLDANVASSHVYSEVPQTRTYERVRLGVLGAGNFASAVMLPALQRNPLIDLIGVVSGAGMSAQHVARKFHFKYADSSETRLLEDADINTVAILTRHHLHASQTIAALDAKKHVFCEKPLALNETELLKIWEALRRNAEEGFSPLLMVGFNRRFAPLSVRLAAFIQERKEPLVVQYRVNAGYIPLSHWVHDPEQGGGRILGEGCHFIDFITFLVGDVPLSVTGFALPDAGIYHADNAVFTFSYPDGSIGTVSYLANGDKAFPKERVEVFTGGKVAVLEDFRKLELMENGKRTIMASRLHQDKGHKAEWEAFANAITSGGLPPIPYSQLDGVTRATFAAVEALQTAEKITVASGG